MKRVILDTNISEFVLKKIDLELLKKLIESKSLVIYGNDVIHNELKNIPKEKIGATGDKLVKLRSALLSIYNLIVGQHEYQLTEDMKKLSEKYFTTYRTLGGNISKEKIINDFIIVACATIKQLDIVASEDNKTMLSEISKKTYEIVNNLDKRKIPKFIGFDEFVEEIRRCASL